MYKFVLPILLLLFLASCEKEQVAPDSSQTDTAVDFRSPGAGRVDICHYSEEDGAWRVISIKEGPALTAHLNHGDAVDMDGDGYFDRENGCSEIDCDDNDYNLKNSCCSEQGYATVELNGLTWLAENLNIAVPGSWYYNNDPTNCTTYGRLYTWEAAQTACKQLGNGWRVPTKAEWAAMIYEYGGYNKLIDGGSSGFNARLGGIRTSNGSFSRLGDYGYYWSATEPDSDRAWYYFFFRPSGQLTGSNTLKSLGLSCRCVQD